MSEGAHAAEAVLTTAAPGVPDIRLAGLVKRFGDFTAVDRIDLDVAHGRVLHAARARRARARRRRCG